MVEILNKVEPRFDAILAYAWYRSEPLGFDGRTAMQSLMPALQTMFLPLSMLSMQAFTPDQCDTKVALPGIEPGLCPHASVGRRRTAMWRPFNRVGRAALYTSLAPDTALRESSQIGTFFTSMTALRADVGPVADARDPAFLAGYSFTEAMIADPAWRARMIKGERVPAQELTETSCRWFRRYSRAELSHGVCLCGQSRALDLGRHA